MFMLISKVRAAMRENIIDPDRHPDPLETIRPESSSHNEDDRRTLVPPSIISQFATTCRCPRMRITHHPSLNITHSETSSPKEIPRLPKLPPFKQPCSETGCINSEDGISRMGY